MKKITFLMLVLFVLSVSSAFSFQDETNANGDLVCGETSGNAGGGTITISLSPKVVAGYTVASDVGSNDWYVIGAFHPGGTKVYATASSVTKIWNAEVGSGQGDQLQTIFDGTPQTPANAGSDLVWSTAGWDAI